MNRWALAVAAWLAVVLATGAFRLVSWVPGSMSAAFVLLPVPEVLLLLAFRLAALRPHRLPVRVLVWLTAGVLVVGNLGELFYRFFYRDHFDPATDLFLLPGLLDMLLQTGFFRSGPGLAVVALLVAGIVLAAGWLVEKGLDAIGGIFPTTPRRRTVVVVILLVAAVCQYAWALTSTVPPANPPPAAEAAPNVPAELVPVAGSVYLLVVESYGHTLFTRSDYRQAMVPVYERFQKTVEAGGWSARSGFLRSPTFGGRSWLADATLLTGQRIRNQEQYDQVVKAAQPNLTQEFGRRGAFRLLAAPGTLQADQAWKRTFAFDRYLFDGGLGYRGPAIGGLGRVSDQFLLYRVGEEARAAGKPVFAQVLLVSSHTPFERLPVYLERWEDLGDGSVYRQDGGILTLGGGGEGYLASIDYVFRCLEGFLERYPGPDDLVVIVGDHQPLIPVSEQDSTFSVPVHVLARNPARLEAMAAWGLDAGLIPRDRPLPHPGLEVLPAIVLSALPPSEGQQAVGQSP